MAKNKIQYKCKNCNNIQPKWLGKCPNCDSWNTFEEYQEQPSKYQKRNWASNMLPKVYGLQEVLEEEEVRISTGFGEFDRVLGGGIVKGSLILITGEPGIGKSTLLLQTLGNVANNGIVLYVSGEESLKQVSLRSKRLKIQNENISLMSETDIISISNVVHELKPILVIIDSIQTMYDPNTQGVTGGIAQVNTCTDVLRNLAKDLNIPIFVVAHMTKDGEIAGPRTFEHMVDVVLFFEGDRSQQIRILRTEKNRNGATHEVGIFEMQEEGLIEVTNPSSLFLSEDMMLGEGATVVPTMEGTRPILAEVQALVAPTYYTNPRRNANGIDLNRLILLSAVLEKKLNLPLGRCDVYVNVVGGLKISERSADLAVALAIISSFKNISLPQKTIVLGEIGLRGEIRNVSRIEQRLREAKKIGWEKAIIPDMGNIEVEGMQIYKVKTLMEAYEFILNS